MNDVAQEQHEEVKYRMRYLPEETENGIFKDYQAGMPVESLADESITKKYGVSRGTVYNVLNRISKKEVKDNGNKEESSEQS